VLHSGAVVLKCLAWATVLLPFVIHALLW
jgi:hypothetical protein